MTLLSLHEAPASLPETGRERWGTDATETPQIGDLWLLSWDGDAQALVLIASTKPGYVTACPITLADEPAFAPAVHLPTSPLGAPLTLWPFLETGLGLHLLHRRFGSALSKNTVENLRRFALGDAEPELTICEPAADTDAAKEFVSALMATMQKLCFNDWPPATAGTATLDREALAANNASIPALRDVLDIPVHRARALLTGDAAPSPTEVEALAAAWDTTGDALLNKPQGDAIDALLSAAVKPALVALMDRRGIDETEARQAAQQEFAFAARSDRKDAATLMREALARLNARSDGTS